MKKRGNLRGLNLPCTFLPENRKGQFYLIAAIVITAIIVGFVSVTNYASAVPSSNLGYLKDEISIESSKAISYGTYNSLTPSGMQSLLENLSYNYINSSAAGDMYFIFGNTGGMVIVGYEKDNLPVSVDGSGLSWLPGQTYTQSFVPSGNNVTIGVGGNEFTFPVYPNGQNFHFILSNINGNQEEYESS